MTIQVQSIIESPGARYQWCVSETLAVIYRVDVGNGILDSIHTHASPPCLRSGNQSVVWYVRSSGIWLVVVYLISIYSGSSLWKKFPCQEMLQLTKNVRALSAGSLHTAR